MLTTRSLGALAAVALAASAAHAQPLAPARVLVADRDADTIWLLFDCDGDGVIEPPDELTVFFSGANLEMTPAPANPNTIGVRRDGLVLIGDTDAGARRYIWCLDLNDDGDALDEDESGIFVDSSNAGMIVTSSPSGTAFDGAGAAYLVNAGNAAGPDAIYRAIDLDGDRNANGMNEAAPWLTTGLFGTGNGPYSPQEIVIDSDGTMYMRNSSANLQGVWRIVPAPGNESADDPDDVVAPYFDSTNMSGVTLGAGLVLDIDRAAATPGTLYVQQISENRVYRLTRGDDNDANDAGEAVLVFSSTEAGLTTADILSLPDGRVLVSSGGNGGILALRDLDADTLYLSSGESSDFLAEDAVGMARAMAILFRSADADRNLRVDATDIFIYLDRWFAQNGQSGGFLEADFDRSGAVDATDIFIYLDRWFIESAGTC